MGQFSQFVSPLRAILRGYVWATRWGYSPKAFTHPFIHHNNSSQILEQGSSFIALEGAVFTSQEEFHFFFPVLAFSMVESLVLFYRALFLRKPCPIFFYASEGALLQIWREFCSTHYVLGGSVEVQILQSILWPFLQDKVLPTTTLSDHP